MSFATRCLWGKMANKIISYLKTYHTRVKMFLSLKVLPKIAVLEIGKPERSAQNNLKSNCSKTAKKNKDINKTNITKKKNQKKKNNKAMVNHKQVIGKEAAPVFLAHLRKVKNLQSVKIGAACALALSILAGGFFYMAFQPVMLLADGQEIGLVPGEKAVAKALETARQELSQEIGMEVDVATSQLSFVKEKSGTGEIIKEEQLVAVLKQQLRWPINTWAIAINGEQKVFLASEAEAKEALEAVKAAYIAEGNGASKDQGQGTVQIETLEFQGEVAVVPAKTTAGGLLTKDEAVQAMLTGMEKIVQHEVAEGESLWTIARDHDLTVAQLKEMNPSLKGELLQIGQRLNLKKAEPLVNVVAVMTTTVEEKIPHPVEYENDDSLWKGQQKVKKSGSDGLKRVTYRITKTNDQVVEKQTLEELVLKEPVTEVVRKGTKLIVASRDGGGNGTLGWPLRGKITSSYGTSRGRSRHTGIDIDGDQGDPVCAAGDGTIIRAASFGTYGKCVDISHGQGLVTRYAHLSAIDVSVGQKVSRGDLIGRVGSTGRSTGSHLHFETILNGKHVSPRQYLD